VPGQERYTAQYDGGGTRVRSRLDGTDHLYSFGAGLLHDTAGDTTYTPGVSQRKDGTDRYFHEDWLGSSRYLSDGTGEGFPTAYRFDAFGGLTAQAGPDSTSAKWGGGQGYQSDGPLGLQLLGARYYDPEVGRFISPDPIGFAGGLNLYNYCYGDPVNYSDPSGLTPDGEYWLTKVVNWGRPYTNIMRQLPIVPDALTTLTTLHDSWQDWGTMEGRNDAGCAGALELWAARGNAAWQTISTATAIYAGGAGVVRAVRLPRTSGVPRVTANAAAGPECFPAGTRIATRNGEKPIEAIRAGDEVLSADAKTGQQSYQKVERTFVSQATTLVVCHG
jgi:RHS repeat-associated protein